MQQLPSWSEWANTVRPLCHRYVFVIVSFQCLNAEVQAMIVSKELIRVAILWHELWHEGLEEASRLFFSEKNPNGMITVLEPLHDMLEAVSYYPLT